MARAWVTDLWVKDAIVTLPDGTKTRLSPSAAQMRSLNALPDHFRSTRFQQGLRWRVTWHESAGGPTKSRAFALKGQADAFAAEMEDDIRMGRYIDPDDKERPFRQVAELWLESKRKIKGATYTRYERELNNYVLPKWGSVKLGAITRAKIDVWVGELQAGTAPYEFDRNKHVKKKTMAAKPLSATYIDHIVDATFGSAIRYAVKERWISNNPLAHVELPRIETKDARLPVLSYSQVEQLSQDAYSLRNSETDRILVLFLAYTGVRVSEALALQVKDLDLDNARADINKTWTTDRAERPVVGPPKGWQKRRVPLQGFVVKALRTLLEGQPEDAWVFQSKRGIVLDRKRWYYHTWRKVLAANEGYPAGLRVHDLRHTAASLAIAAGADVKIVQLMLGHKDATETLNIYGHMWPDKLGEVVSMMAEKRAEELGLQVAA